MKGHGSRNSRRASINLELSLLITLLILSAIIGLSWMGSGIGNQFLSAAGALGVAGGITDGSSVDNGDGSYDIGWDGGTPPFDIIRATLPDLSDGAVIGSTPDQSYTIPETDLLPGDNYIGIIDGDGNKLEDPIVITRTLWLSWRAKSLSLFDPITTAGGVEVHALRLDYFPEGGDVDAWTMAHTLYATDTQFWQPTLANGGVMSSVDLSDNFTGTHRTTIADANGNFQFYNLTPGFWLFCAEMTPFNTTWYGDNALGYSCDVLMAIGEPNSELWYVNLQPSTQASTPDWLHYWRDEQLLGRDHAVCFLNRRTIEHAADLYVSLGYGSYTDLNGVVDELSPLPQAGLLLPPMEGGSYYTLVDGETACPTGTHLGTP